MPKHAQSRSNKLKHFFTDIFTGDQIHRCLTRQEPCIYDSKDLPSSEKIKIISAKYENMTFEKITPRTDREIKQDIKDVIIDLDMYDKNGLGIVGEHGKITD